MALGGSKSQCGKSLEYIKVLAPFIQEMISSTAPGGSLSSKGWVLKRMCSSMYSLGGRLTRGVGQRNSSQAMSARHRNEGTQPKPDSQNMTLSSGNFSNVPSK